MKNSLLKSHLVFGFTMLLIAVGSSAYAQKSAPNSKTSLGRGTGSQIKLVKAAESDPSDPVIADKDKADPAKAGQDKSDPAKTAQDKPTQVNDGVPAVITTGVNGTTNQPDNTDKNGTLGKKDGLEDKSQVGGVSNERKSSGKRVGSSAPSPQAPRAEKKAEVKGVTSEAVQREPVTGVTATTQTGQGDPVEQADEPMVGSGVQTPVVDNAAKAPVVVGSGASAPVVGSSVKKAPVMVGSQAPVVGSVAQTPPCEDEAVTKLVESLKKDESGVMSSLYELTSRRLALRALKGNSDSLEALARKGVNDLELKVKKMKGSDAYVKKMQAVYEAYGKGADLTKLNQNINHDLDSMVKRAKVACYWTRYSNNQRILNSEASSLVLALGIGEKNSGLTDIDAATIWTMEKVRSTAEKTDPDYRIGGEKGNLMNMSTRVARYLGKIGKGRNATQAELEKEINRGQEDLDAIFAKAYDQVKASLYACIDDHNKSCPSCAEEAKKSFESNRLDFNNLQRKLLQVVSKSDNVKMESVLKAKMGEVTFDLSDFAMGTVPEDLRPTISKKDSCGNTIVRKPVVSSTRAPARAEVETVTPSDDQRYPVVLEDE
jgi:hypothetical protein